MECRIGIIIISIGIRDKETTKELKSIEQSSPDSKYLSDPGAEKLGEILEGITNLKIVEDAIQFEAF